MLNLINVSKIYKTQERNSGLKGILKDMIKPSYATINALNNISLQINEGEKIAIVGKNGSGKSTLVKIFSGILRPTSGNILFYKKNLYDNSKYYKKNIGVMFGQRSQLYPNMIFSESIELFRLIYGLDKATARKRIALLTEQFNLEALLKKPIREMSLGQRIKCEIASVLFHEPKIVFFDEPTIGLDIEVKEQFYNLIQNYNNYNKLTLILISHDVNDVINLSDRLLILNKGILQDDIPTKDFIDKYDQSKVITISFFNKIDYNEKIFFTFKLLKNDKNRHIVSFLVDKIFTIGEIIKFIDKKENIYDIKIENEDFLKILLNYYKKKI